MMRSIAVLTILGICALSWASAEVEKPGTCNRRYKRDVCQCNTLGGPDDCADECTSDEECYGSRKCCTVVCKRVCVPPARPLPPRGVCPPAAVWNPCPPVTDPGCQTPCPAAPCPPCPEPPCPPCPPPPCPPQPPPYPQPQPQPYPCPAPPCPPCPEPPCPPCPGPPCPPQPQPQPPYPQPQPPGEVCQPRCVCRPGFVEVNGRCFRNATVCPPPGQVLPPPQPRVPVCPRIHEVYHTCYRGCQPSCYNQNPTCAGDYCLQGCFCAPGFFRNGHGRCVRTCPPKPDDSRKSSATPRPPECPPNQEFSICKRDCEPTCTSPNPRGCYRKCQVGCFCRRPYVRDHYGSCIENSSCPIIELRPPICRDNERYIACNNKCEATCDNPRAENCNRRCLSGCFCVEGYVRVESGECIPERDCPPPQRIPDPIVTPGTPVCESDYEEYLSCYRGCQRTCDNPTGTIGCTNQGCLSGCFCKPGLLLTSNGHCVQPSQCPNNGCGPTEHWEECDNPCPDSCQNDTYVIGGVNCDQPCYTGCVCNDGYIRNRTDTTCIPVDHCRPHYGYGYGGRTRCGSYEDAVPCGRVCEQECEQGWGSVSCPPTCRNRCCRRRFAKFLK